MKTLQQIFIVAMVMGAGLPVMAQAPPSYLILRSPQNSTRPIRQHIGYDPPVVIKGQCIAKPTPMVGLEWHRGSIGLDILAITEATPSGLAVNTTAARSWKKASLRGLN